MPAGPHLAETAGAGDAAVYDALDPDGSDLDVYAAMVTELGARRVLDVGCGTGTFALMLASGASMSWLWIPRPPRSMSPAASRAADGCGGCPVMPPRFLRKWTATSETLTEVPGYGPVRHWVQLTGMDLPLVSFEAVRVFGDQSLVSTSTLRFRSETEVSATLPASGYQVCEVREAPDRPSRELVFIARRAGS